MVDRPKAKVLSQRTCLDFEEKGPTSDLWAVPAVLSCPVPGSMGDLESSVGRIGIEGQRRI